MSLNTFGGTAEFQYVPVPNRFVVDVMAYLSRLQADEHGDVPVVDVDSPAGADVDGVSVDGLSDDELAYFVTRRTRIAGTVASMLDVLSRDPESPMGTAELAEATGRKITQIKIVPTQIARVGGRRDGDHNGPLRGDWGLDMTPPRDGQMYYWVTAERAAQWERVRAQIA